VEDSRVKKDIIKDEIISFKSIECDPCNIIFELWNKQIKLF
ncbi:unnamed protein product, partial [marine sediment metagenome]